jgi:YHS domain-containing protein
MKKLETGIAWIVAIIFFQTLFFKFTGSSESVWIFTQLKIDPWGRILSGVMELIAAGLLIIPRTRAVGSLLGCGIMFGAIASHILVLGIEIQNDGGLLFCLAMISFLGSAFLLVRKYKELPLINLLGLLFLFPLMVNAKVSYNNESKFGIHGYDPVSYLTDNKAIEGIKSSSSTYDGVTYLFSSESNKEKFIKNPLQYLPAYGGWCAYAMADGDKVDIDPKTFKIIGGKTYLFYNGLWGNTLEKWNKSETKLKMNADTNWIKIIK